MKLLLIEDVAPLAELMSKALETEGFTVDVAISVADAKDLLKVAQPDVIVLDLGLPDGDGRDILASLRRAGNDVPVLVVTARAGLNDKIEGLDGGADDYVVKPAAPAEIAARCRALLRRPGGLLGRSLGIANLTFDTATRSILVDGKILIMARREIDVLELLLRRRGLVVSRHAMEAAIYGISEVPGPNALEASISRLRRALADAGAALEIHTIRGVGYLLDEARRA
jgi:DNA-binding response OmpR family regulator